MHGHQRDGVDRLDDRVGHAGREPIDLIRDARHGRIPAVLNPPHESAHLLQARLRLRGLQATQLERVGRIGQHAIEHLGGRESIDEPHPLAHAAAGQRERAPVVVRQGGGPGGQVGANEGRRQRAGERQQSRVRDAHEARAQQRGHAELRRRVREKPDERAHILDLVGVEEAHPLVDVRRDPPAPERVLELPVALARAEQNGHVLRPDGAGTGTALLPHLAVAEQRRDLGGDRGSARLEVLRGDDAERVARGLGRRKLLDRKAVPDLEPESIAAGPTAADLGEQIVDEPEQARHRPEAVADGTAHVTADAQAGYLVRRLAERRDVGIPEAVNRLLVVAHDEDGRRQGRLRHETATLAPGLDQQRYQLPLAAARILELVDQDVVVARLEAVARLGELVHLPQEIDRPLQHVGEVEQGARTQRALVLRHDHAEQHAHGAGEHDVDVPAARRVQAAPGP